MADTPGAKDRFSVRDSYGGLLGCRLSQFGQRSADAGDFSKMVDDVETDELAYRSVLVQCEHRTVELVRRQMNAGLRGCRDGGGPVSGVVPVVFFGVEAIGKGRAEGRADGSLDAVVVLLLRHEEHG